MLEKIPQKMLPRNPHTEDAAEEVAEDPTEDGTEDGAGTAAAAPPDNKSSAETDTEAAAMST